MKTPLPNDDESMRDALQRDAARVPEPSFDPALHHAAMRRIRALADPEVKASRFHSWPALITAAAVLTLSVLALWRSPSAPVKPHPAGTVSLTAPSLLPRSSQLAYQTAASHGDEALFTLLDRDARTLLPASSPIFNAPLN